MDQTCPECDRPLEPLDDAEMFSGTRRFRCLECEIVYERDVSGLLTETYPPSRARRARRRVRQMRRISAAMVLDHADSFGEDSSWQGA